MMLDVRPQPYRSSRAVAPSSGSTAPRGSPRSSLIDSIYILLGITTALMVLANLGTLFLFNTEVSLHKHTAQINVNVENGETFTHRSVHKNIQLHQQIVRQHLDQKRAEEKNKKWTAVREARKDFKKGSKLAPMDDGDDDTEEFDYTEEEVLTDAQPLVKSDVKKDNDQALKEAPPLVKSDVKTEETPASKEAHLKLSQKREIVR